MSRVTFTHTAIKRTGKIKCAYCNKDVVNGKTLTTMFFCPDSKCSNSEERYLD